jgi:hypothetical protein
MFLSAVLLQNAETCEHVNGRPYQRVIGNNFDSENIYFFPDYIINVFYIVRLQIFLFLFLSIPNLPPWIF